MNLTQAEAIASLYSELIESIDFTKITPPLANYGQTFSMENMNGISLEDGQVKIQWSRYAGCGDYDTDETYHSLDSLFI